MQDNQNDGANRLTIILANVEDINEVKEEATDCHLIEILDGSTVIQSYEDYTNFQSISSDAEENVDVTVAQPSLVKQVENLKTTVKAQAKVIADQDATIKEQEQTINQQAEQIAELQESQEVQDGYIDYISMMTDVDLPTEDDGEGE
jgi:uncharacterized coiled-coil protein SlyX